MPTFDDGDIRRIPPSPELIVSRYQAIQEFNLEAFIDSNAQPHHDLDVDMRHAAHIARRSEMDFSLIGLEFVPGLTNSFDREAVVLNVDIVEPQWFAGFMECTSLEGFLQHPELTVLSTDVLLCIEQRLEALQLLIPSAKRFAQERALSLLALQEHYRGAFTEISPRYLTYHLDAAFPRFEQLGTHVAGLYLGSLPTNGYNKEDDHHPNW